MEKKTNLMERQPLKKKKKKEKKLSPLFIMLNKKTHLCPPHDFNKKKKISHVPFFLFLIIREREREKREEGVEERER